MSNELFDLGVNWDKDSGDCTPCAVCNEPIYGNKYSCILEVGEQSDPMDVVLCESCYTEKFPS